MPSTIVRIFVDTNIWVYALDRGDPAKQAAALDLIRRDPAAIVVSTQVMGELFVTLTRLGAPSASAEDAARAVDALRRFTVVSLEPGHVMFALELFRQHSLSYWDALIIATARAGGCARLVTEDLADGAEIAGVRIENPFLARRRRLAESRRPYAGDRARTWTDEDLRDELERYRETCAAAGMRPGAVHAYWDYARRFLGWREGIYPRGGAPRPVPLGPLDLDGLRADVAAYARWLDGAGLSHAAAATYVRHAGFFARWLAGQFDPGARLRRSPEREGLRPGLNR
jgi:predicted nucleic acid-binding protein